MVKTREKNPVLMFEIRDKILYKFIQRLFIDVGDGTLLVSTWTATGSVLSALVEVAPSVKVLSEASDSTVRLMLPASNLNRDLLSKMIFLTPDNHAKVMVVLRREFHLVFSSYIAECGLAGLSKKQSVQLFIEEYDLGDIETSFETLTKKRQRTTTYALTNLNLKLRKMAYNYSQKIRKKIRNAH